MVGSGAQAVHGFGRERGKGPAVQGLPRSGGENVILEVNGGGEATTDEASP